MAFRGQHDFEITAHLAAVTERVADLLKERSVALEALREIRHVGLSDGLEAAMVASRAMEKIEAGSLTKAPAPEHRPILERGAPEPVNGQATCASCGWVEGHAADCCYATEPEAEPEHPDMAAWAPTRGPLGEWGPVEWARYYRCVAADRTSQLAEARAEVERLRNQRSAPRWSGCTQRTCTAITTRN